MLRNYRLAFGMALILTLSTQNAQAQWGWGGWGGGGGGSTVQGDIARGAGYYNMGAGVYNLDTAQATSINTDTLIRYNDYLWQSQQVINKREYLRMARRQQRDSSNGQHIYERLRDNPEAADIDRGDALNVILDQVTNPRIHSSALRMANDSISSQTVRNISFVNASEAIALSLNQLTAKDSWPLFLRSQNFANDRKDYQDAVAKALDEDEREGGQISPETLQQITDVVARLRAKLESNRPPNRDMDFIQAETYVKGLGGMARMLRSASLEKALAEVQKVSKTSLGSLLGFMHAYNLRFGPATTPDQKAVYEKLYPLMDAYRDRVLKDTDIDGSKDTSVARGKGHPTDLFQGMHLDNQPNNN